MNIHKGNLIGLAVAASLAIGITGGCSKQSQEPPKPPRTAPSTTKAPRPATSTTANAPAGARLTTTSRLAKSQPVNSVPASTLEKNYRAETDAKAKTDILYQLADLNNREALEVLGALFQTETDAELKEEIVNVLDLIDEHEKQKLDILAVAVVPAQPHDLRLAAIDSLGDLEDPNALKVLKSLLKDPNEEIREAAQDAIEFFEATALPK